MSAPCRDATILAAHPAGVIIRNKPINSMVKLEYIRPKFRKVLIVYVAFLCVSLLSVFFYYQLDNSADIILKTRFTDLSKISGLLKLSFFQLLFEWSVLLFVEAFFYVTVFYLLNSITLRLKNLLKISFFSYFKFLVIKIFLYFSTWPISTGLILGYKYGVISNYSDTAFKNQQSYSIAILSLILNIAFLYSYPLIVKESYLRIKLKAIRTGVKIVVINFANSKLVIFLLFFISLIQFLNNNMYSFIENNLFNKLLFTLIKSAIDFAIILLTTLFIVKFNSREQSQLQLDQISH
jgi:hypothetical protein